MQSTVLETMKLKLRQKGNAQPEPKAVEHEEERQNVQLLPDSVIYHIMCSMEPKELVRSQVR